MPRTVTTEARTRLLEAGERLAGRATGALTARVVAKEAGLPERHFRDAFGDARGFLVELHQRFLKAMLEKVILAFSAHPPGVERMRHGMQAFMDFCLQHRELRRLMLEHELDPGLAEVALGRRRGFLQMLKLEFDAMGWLHTDEAARLYRVMIEEASRAELEAGRALPETRQTLIYFIQG